MKDAARGDLGVPGRDRVGYQPLAILREREFDCGSRSACWSERAGG